MSSNSISVTVRNAEPGDAEAVVRLLEQLGYPNDVATIRERIERMEAPDTVILVATIETHIAGVAGLHRIPLFHTKGFLGRITSFVVDEYFHRRGVGKRLLEHIDLWAKASGCERIEVTSGDHRTEAHAFYQAMGYTFDQRRFIRVVE